MILLNAAGSGRKPSPAGNSASSRMLAFRDDIIQMVRIMARKAAASKRRAGPARKSGIRRRKPGSSRRTATASRRRWSQEVTEHSDALTLEGGVFTSKDPRRIAASLKRSAERSNRRKSDPFRSALSMLTFYINRAGKNLPPARKKILMQAKEELRKQFGKD
jgi:hypothetical protein